MADCPKCSEVLSNPKSCACGWKSRLRAEKAKLVQHEREFIECAHEGCGEAATVRLKAANLCLTHYERHFKREADKRFTELGLDRWANESRTDHRKRVFEYLKLMAKVKRFEDAVRV